MLIKTLQKIFKYNAWIFRLHDIWKIQIAHILLMLNIKTDFQE